MQTPAKKIPTISANSIELDHYEKLNKSTIQKKAEAELWRQKYETQMSQMIQIKANYELEIKNLSQELAKLHFQLNNMETIQNRQQSDQKLLADSQQYMAINELKKSQIIQSDLYEAQLKKLRNLLENKTSQVNDLQTKLERMKCEFESEQHRHKNEIEQYHLKISEIEKNHQQEIQQLKSKYDFYNQTQFKNTNDAHANQIDLLQQENFKVKQLIEIKDTEIETLIQQNQTQKIQSEDTICSLRRDIQLLKEQLQQQDLQHQQEWLDLQLQLEKKNQQQLINLKNQQQQQFQNYQQENDNLKRILESKKDELNKQIQEKSRQKANYDSELNMLRQDYDQQRQKYDARDAERSREINDLILRMERLQQNHQDNEKQTQNHIEHLEKEISVLSTQLTEKQNEIVKQQQELQKLINEYETNIYKYRDQIDAMNIRIRELENDKKTCVDELYSKFNQDTTVYQQKIKQLETQLIQFQELISKLREQLNNKTKDLDQAQSQKFMIEQQIRKVKEDYDRLQQKLNEFDFLKNSEMEEMRIKLEDSHFYQIENLKTAYNTQYQVLQSEINDLRSQIALKQRDYIDLLDNYQQLERSSRQDLTGSRFSQQAYCEAVCRSLSRSNARKM